MNSMSYSHVGVKSVVCCQKFGSTLCRNSSKYVLTKWESHMIACTQGTEICFLTVHLYGESLPGCLDKAAHHILQHFSDFQEGMDVGYDLFSKKIWVV